MPGVRSVALGAWVRAASLHESPENMGVSHLLEHMVFKGTDAAPPQELALALESVGGSLDAYTSREHTAYQARVLDEHVEICGRCSRRPDLPSAAPPVGSRSRAQGRARGDQHRRGYARRSRLRAAWRAAVGRPSLRLPDPRHSRHVKALSTGDLRALARARVSSRSDGGRRGGEHRARRSARASQPGRVDRSLAAASHDCNRWRPSRFCPRSRISSARAPRPMSGIGSGDLTHDPAPVRADAGEHAARRRHELAAVPAGSRGARAGVRCAHLSELSRRYGGARGVCRNGPENASDSPSTRYATSLHACRPREFPKMSLPLAKTS